MELIPFSAIDNIELREMNEIRRPGPRGRIFHTSYGRHLTIKRSRKTCHANYDERYAKIRDIFHCQNMHTYVHMHALAVLMTGVYRNRANYLYVLPPHILNFIVDYLRGVTTFITF